MSTATSSKLASLSQVYTWEPSNRVIAQRYGLDAAAILRFDLNTSPSPPSMVFEVLSGAFDPALNEYPDSTYAELAEAAAAYVGAGPEEILVGSGADEVLDIVAKAFLAPGQDAIVPIPTYSMYGVLTGQRGARLRAVPRLGPDAGFGLDMATMRAQLETAALVWLCSPNNPTGAPESAADVMALLEAGAALDGGGPVFVVDEAYHEFYPESFVAARQQYPRLIVVRTLSKAFALAGMRVGYAVAARSTIERLERLRPPGSISTVSATVAAAALRQSELARHNVTVISAERERLSAGLAERGLTTYPSVANFILCRIGTQEEAEAATDDLLQHGIVARTFGPANPLRGHLRFTVRDREQNDRLLDVVGAWRERRST